MTHTHGQRDDADEETEHDEGADHNEEHPVGGRDAGLRLGVRAAVHLGHSLSQQLLVRPRLIHARRVRVAAVDAYVHNVSPVLECRLAHAKKQWSRRHGREDAWQAGW